MTTEITTYVELRTRIDRACEKKQDRYALHCAEVIPANDEPSVYLTATDGRQASVIRCVGRTDARRNIPPHVLPAKRIPAKGKHSITRNGQWESSDGRYCADPEEARYPKVVDVIGEVSDETHATIGIDVAQLQKIADATGSERLVMFVPRQAVTGGTTYVPVLAFNEQTEGFGIFASQDPTANPGPGKVKIDPFAMFNERRAAYVTAQESTPR